MTWITKFLKNPKIPAKNRWLILLLFGLLILVIAMPVSDPKSTKRESGESRSTERTTQDAYAATVERKLTSMLSCVFFTSHLATCTVAVPVPPLV